MQWKICDAAFRSLTLPVNLVARFSLSENQQTWSLRPARVWPNYQTGRTNVSEMRHGCTIDLFIQSTLCAFPTASISSACLCLSPRCHSGGQTVQIIDVMKSLTHQRWTQTLDFYFLMAAERERHSGFDLCSLRGSNPFSCSCIAAAHNKSLHRASLFVKDMET